MEIRSNYQCCTCGECGIHFAIPVEYWLQLRDNHETFYCPKGHPRYYPKESDEEKLKKQLNTCKRKIDDLSYEKEVAQKSAISYKAHFKRVKNKAV